MSAVEYLERYAFKHGRAVVIIPSTSRLLVATIRRTLHTERVQFTYCGKRISRARAKELLET